MEFDVKKLSKDVKIVREAFAKLHAEAGCYYGRGKNKKDYIFHLDGVVGKIVKYIHLLPKEVRNEVIKAGYGHDSVEDCGISPNDMVKIVGDTLIHPLYGKGLAATIIYCVTDELGWNRKQRSEKTLPKINQLDLAIFLKLCDRIFNVEYSQETAEQGDKHTMYNKYCEEFINFVNELYDPETEFQELWDDLATLSKFKGYKFKKLSFGQRLARKLKVKYVDLRKSRV